MVGLMRVFENKEVPVSPVGAICAQYPDCLYLSVLTSASRSINLACPARSADWERGESASSTNSISARPDKAALPSCQSLQPSGERRS
jgi:hypothetical protein